MYEVTINRWKPDENGKRIYYRETFAYYESADEADKNGVPYHQDWKEAYILNELKSGDYVLTEEGHVIPTIEVKYGSFPLVRTPTGSFNPDNKYGLTYKESKDRRAFEKRSDEGAREDNPGLCRAAWHFARYGDPTKAYLFAYCNTHWISKMSKEQIEKRAGYMCRRVRFARLYMVELSKHFEEAGVTPAQLLKNIRDRVINPKEKYENVEKGTKLLLALHPDFREQVIPMIVIGGKGQLQLTDPNPAEDVEYTEIEEEGEVNPGQHIEPKKNDENKKTKTVDAVVSDDLSSEPVLEGKA
ncbi:hypothetical protein LCGC14_0351950 [marine sediment metagenome]|uniref:Uncharacterized protein n=1 Tax=marine sediment metagenome TaxID=412755 RepID=A0A0F9VY40_9ZZZZ